MSEYLPKRITTVRQSVCEQDKGSARRQGDGIFVQQQVIKYTDCLSGGMRKNLDVPFCIHKHGQFMASTGEIEPFTISRLAARWSNSLRGKSLNKGIFLNKMV